MLPTYQPLPERELRLLNSVMSIDKKTHLTKPQDPLILSHRWRFQMEMAAMKRYTSDKCCSTEHYRLDQRKNTDSARQSSRAFQRMKLICAQTIPDQRRPRVSHGIQWRGTRVVPDNVATKPGTAPTCPKATYKISEKKLT